jgi:hypothetical protein
LEGVGRCARFIGPAAEHLRAAGLHCPRRFQQLFPAFHRAGAGNHGKCIVTYGQAAVSNLYYGLFGMEFFIRQLVGLRYGHKTVNPGHQCQVFVVDAAFVAHKPDDCKYFALGQMRRQPDLPDFFHHSVDVRFGGIWFHYDDHVIYPVFVCKVVLTAVPPKK